MRTRLLVLAAGPALAFAGTASTTATKLLGGIGHAYDQTRPRSTPKS